MYNLGDLSFQLQPKFLSKHHVNLLAKRIRDYCLSENKRYFEIIIHGGEPLLMPIGDFEYFLEEFNTILRPEIIPVFSVQTNGLLLNESWFRLFERNDMSLSISIDGPETINDLHRIDHRGRSTYDRTLSGIRSAMEFFGSRRDIGVLAVMTPKSDPIVLYRFFKDVKVRNLDFLFPHHNYDNLPKREHADSYSDWWIGLFTEWYFDEDYDKPNIRFLTQLIVTVLGCNVGFDMLGNHTSNYLIIETDGSIETVDGLKSCGDGFTKEGIHIQTHQLKEAIQAPLIRLYHESHVNLPDVCQRCPINEICGGGFLAHRYGQEKGFNNPTVYCRDLVKIIAHVQNVVIGGLSKSTRRAAMLEAIDVREVLADIGRD
ncbi:hypothetical protein MUK70_25600 [Dyadobacter chenwenxiniae]|uniref:Radical SAM core domain-containing protein n=2 Tax=Dyadobacter chenwenxiniae TaxID=2906456 RepID=A0A9X1PQR5_9BACT|nr:hypothetical protein [Dyadobacter chenwenxiniae]UON82400.1 hypothetical protein MUK70_25600 [Dyadobacter chenwenxiniae]